MGQHIHLALAENLQGRRRRRSGRQAFSGFSPLDLWLVPIPRHIARNKSASDISDRKSADRHTNVACAVASRACKAKSSPTKVRIGVSIGNALIGGFALTNIAQLSMILECVKADAPRRLTSAAPGNDATTSRCQGPRAASAMPAQHGNIARSERRHDCFSAVPATHAVFLDFRNPLRADFLTEVNLAPQHRHLRSSGGLPCRPEAFGWRDSRRYAFQ